MGIAASGIFSVTAADNCPEVTTKIWSIHIQCDRGSNLRDLSSSSSVSRLLNANFEPGSLHALPGVRCTNICPLLPFFCTPCWEYVRTRSWASSASMLRPRRLKLPTRQRMRLLKEPLSSTQHLVLRALQELPYQSECWRAQMRPLHE